MSTPKTDGNGRRIGVDFIDVLFAIVIGISATKVLDEPWLEQGPSFM